MSKLSIDQRNIKALFQDRKSDFLIPDYQRPYAWDESKCETLWEDLFAFALPGQFRIPLLHSKNGHNA